ncbi:hypothetical protein H072_2500 [Dactylellina haptotyla CBS 200.50]|uniref:NmrA-like domain-containing protein n=1 Tax=Dactylellina haptotyla (strain CBS 200.50) TaxID=1284197 RepID=S8AR24_DACHA|nr:hypothetical protein H072_2500 [Dactylellina haptotyla CBS 200.50]
MTTRIDTVFALVRDIASEKAQALQAAGAVLVQGDLDNADSLTSAFQSSNPTAVFLNIPPGPADRQVSHARNIIAAAQSCPSVTTLIGSSSIVTGQHESFPGWSPQYITYDYWIGKELIETLVRDAGFASWTIVRLGFFFQLLTPPMSTLMFPELWPAQSVDGGNVTRILRSAFKPDAKLPWVHGGDVGVIVAAALERPEEFKGRIIDLAGELVTITELGEKIAKGTGEEVRVICSSEEQMAESLGPLAPRLIAAQLIFTEIQLGDDVGKTKNEFKLTSVEDFFPKF